MEKTSLDLVAFGWALSGTLVVLFVLCALAAMIFPGWQLAHGWLSLFSVAPAGSIRNLADGIVFSVIFGWVSAAIFVTIYNRLSHL
jgi:hypothetical protein